MVTFGPTSERSASYARRSVSLLDKADDSLPTGSSLVAPVREEQLRVAARTEIETAYRRAPCPKQRPLRRRPEIEMALHENLVPERRPVRSGDVVPDLIATGTDSGPDHRFQLALGSKSSDSGLDDAGQKAAPTDVQEPEPGRPGGAVKGNGKAVGREQRHGLSALLRPDPIALVEVRGIGRDPGGGSLGHLRAVLLPNHGQTSRISVYGPAETPAILAHPLGLVLRQQPQVQRSKATLAHTTLPGREDDVVRSLDSRVEHVHAPTIALITFVTLSNALESNVEN